jgi:hypothetical protein
MQNARKIKQKERGRENCNFLTPLSSLPRPFHQREEERPETWLGQDFFFMQASY